MPRHLAIVATTGKLPNGFQHSVEDLEVLANAMRDRITTDPFLNENHLEGKAPLARQYEAYVAPLVRNGVEVPGEFALYVTFEVLPGADPDTVARFIENGGFSVAFFGEGVGRGPKEGAELRLLVGISVEVLPDVAAAKLLLDALARDLPDVELEVRRYHEHALLTTSALLMVFGWVAGKVAEKLFDRVWTALQNAAVKAWRATVKRVKLTFNTRKGTVHAMLPSEGPPEKYRLAVQKIVEEVVDLDAGTVRRRISLMVNEEWEVERHSEDL